MAMRMSALPSGESMFLEVTEVTGLALKQIKEGQPSWDELTRSTTACTGREPSADQRATAEHEPIVGDGAG